MLFAAMEEEVRKHIEDSQEGCRDILFTVISSNDEVLFHWCLLTADTKKCSTNNFAMNKKSCQ